MGLAIDHNQHGTLSPGNTSFNISVTSTTGNLLVIMFVGASTGKVTSVHDNVNSNYTQVGAGGGTPVAVQIFYFKAAQAGAITLTVACASNTFGWNFYDISGADAITSLDNSTIADNQTASATPSGPSMNANVANDFVCACVGSSGTISAVGAPFTGDFFDSTVSGGGFAHVSPASAINYNPSWTNSGPVSWNGISAAFLEAVPVPAKLSYTLNTFPKKIMMAINQLFN